MGMVKVLPLNGDDAASYAMKQIDPDVVAAYPITPQTELMQNFAQFHSDGAVQTELITVESEHSAMSACVGASAAGGRVMTATSSQGLALMWEILYIASAYRLPIAMNVINRTLSGPINIHCDHSDTMGARDSGWLQVYGENPQEAYDNTIQVVRIAEHMNLRLPVMCMQDGFITFVGDFVPTHPLLDIDNPVTFGPLDLYDYFFEHKRQQIDAMSHGEGIVKEIAQEFEKISGRAYPVLEPYAMDDAETAIVVLSSTAGTTRETVKDLRAKGEKVGMVKIRCFRPFPQEELINQLKDVKVAAVLDRSDGLGAFGAPVFNEVRNALYDAPSRPEVVNYVFGLGGRDIGKAEIASVYSDLEQIHKTGEVKQRISYLGVRD
jgi:pyruvate ferredoxin oxidoreductase alpha subunit